MAREELDRTLRDLQAASGDGLDAAVHNARRRLKRLRSLLRLFRHELGAEVYARENACFRTCASCLSAARDARVLADTFAALAEPPPSRRQAPAFNTVANFLRQRHGDESDRARALRRAVPRVARQLRTARRRVRSWPLFADTWESVGCGLRKTHRRCRRLGALAVESGRPEACHAWRKFVKYLWHQTEMLSPAWPEVLRPLATQWRALATLLGRHHDLELLATALKRDAKALGGEAALKPVLARIRARQQEVHTQACQLAARLFSEKTSAYERRLRVCWEAWRNG